MEGERRNNGNNIEVIDLSNCIYVDKQAEDGRP